MKQVKKRWGFDPISGARVRLDAKDKGPKLSKKEKSKIKEDLFWAHIDK